VIDDEKSGGLSRSRTVENIKKLKETVSCDE
jgi:hypothetical protein